MIIHKLSMGSCKVPHKIWSRSVQPFLRLLDTNKQTDSKIFILLGFKGASRHLLFQLWTCSLCIIVKQKQEKFRGCYKKNRVFSKCSKIEIWEKQIFGNSIICKPSLGSREVPQKFWRARFSSFEVYWIQTDR